jgi:YbgC/YbaW family acyl-CoA thioester hydrolase
MRGPEILKSSHTVMSYELDAWGHVNNAIYLNYLEKARNDFLISKGLNFNDFFKWQKFPVVREAILEFKYPAKSGDELLINGWVSDHTAIRFTLSYEIVSQKSQKLVLSAKTMHVFVNQRNKPIRMPDEFYQKFIIPSLNNPG